MSRRSKHPPGAGAPRAKHQGRFTPRVEPLEDRAVPALFAPALSYPVGLGPTAVTAGDFDGDGKLDLATIDSGDLSIGVTAKVTVLLNIGSGFAPAPGPPIPVGDDARNLVAGDFNGDGLSDIAVANYYGSPGYVVRVFLASGGGRFAESPGSPVPASFKPDKIASGHLNGDDKLDLVTANQDGTVSILINQGGGRFVNTGNLPADVATGASQLSVFDFNGDGKPDIGTVGPALIANVLLGDGQGGFESRMVLPWLGVFAAGDFTGDGKLDLAVEKWGPPTSVSLFQGDGQGRYTAMPGATFGLPENETVLAAEDLNGDGRLDLAMTRNFANNVLVYLGSGDGVFSPESGSPYPVGPNPVGLGIRDFNGDGKPDLAVCIGWGDSVSVLLNIGSRAPIAQDDVTGTDEGVSVSIDVLANDWDPEHDPLTLRIAGQPAFGVAAVNDNNTPGDPRDDSITYSPRPGLYGVDTLRYEVRDPAGNVAAARALVTVKRASADTDGDGLLDRWERNWFDSNGDGAPDANGIDIDGDGRPDVALPGANPLHKDLYVEVDAMSGRAPRPEALDMVVASFAAVPNRLVNNPDTRDGVSLHCSLDGADTAIPLAPWTIYNRSGWPAGFDNTKDEWFGTRAEREGPNAAIVRAAKKLAYRYCVFADYFDALGSSGCAELPGNDFMVTLGKFPVAGGTTKEQAGAFMHELGHALGLEHGGGESTNYKPNYHSVMNYLWTFPQPGYQGNWILDYSRRAFLTLDERNLDETAGIGGDVRYYLPVGPPQGPRFQFVREGGPVDWNRNGRIDNFDPNHPIARDVNYQGDRFEKPSPGQRLVGFEDWSNLRYALTSSLDYADGTHLNTTSHDEITAAIQAALSEIPPPLPTVTAVVLNDGSAQRSRVTSITVTFSTSVGIDAGAFVLQKQGLGPVGLAASVTSSSGGTVVVLTFVGSDIVAGSLADGRYTLTIRSDHIHDALGQPLDGKGDGAGRVDRSESFFRLFGDSDGDGDVDYLDYALFRSSYTKRQGVAGYLWYFDTDGDGLVGPADYARFLQNFGKTV